MIHVKVREDMISMRGHAAGQVPGNNIVCAAVSALTCNLVNSLEEFTESKISAKTSSGEMDIKWDKLDDKGKLLIDSWFIGLSEINNKYSCISWE